MRNKFNQIPKPKPKAKVGVTAVNPVVAKKSADLLQQGLALHNAGQLEQARAIYEEILKLNPKHFDALQLLGAIAAQTKQWDKALGLLTDALKINTTNASVYNNRGIVLQELKRLDEALASYDRAIEFKRDYAEAYSNRGNVLKELKRLDEALASYEKALNYKPDYAEAYSNKGNLLNELKRFEEALANHIKAIQLKPELPEAHYNQGIVFGNLKLFDKALESYQKAINLKSDYAEAYLNHASALKGMDYLDEAIVSYEKVFEINPDHNYLPGILLHSKMLICNWQDFDDNLEKLMIQISEDKKPSNSFPFLGLSDSLSLNFKVSKASKSLKFRNSTEFVNHNNFENNISISNSSDNYGGKKIKLAFLSADFKEHPMGYNFVGFFEKIDRSKFEVIAVSFLNVSDSPLSKRLVAAFDLFKVVDKLTDTEVCKWIVENNVDIAVDMMGDTDDNRNDIFAMRCAPIQVNQFSWTSGATFIDYIIADPISIPEEYAYGYSEKLAYVPHTLFATDNKKEISINTPSRAEQQLPEQGFIFCCFNNNFKITPYVFDVWMNILKKVPGSVLWIKGGRESLEANLRREATERGVDASRLVFARQIPSMQDHLARYRLADVFLDTFPFCAQTTASDALWAGVPVVTRVGETSMSRICASLLHALEMPELVTATHEAYADLAIELALNPAKLKAVKDKLEHNRHTAPLFDTQQYTRDIETAYKKMYERYKSNLPPEHIRLDF